MQFVDFETLTHCVNFPLFFFLMIKLWHTGIADNSCSKGEVCAPLHTRILRLFVSKSELEDEDKFFKDGACAKQPDGGMVMPGPDNELPAPLAYFPLTGGSVKAWPAENAQGFAVNTETVEDDAFGE